jgi:hypothetical protein
MNGHKVRLRRLAGRLEEGGSKRQRRRYWVPSAHADCQGR